MNLHIAVNLFSSVTHRKEVFHYRDGSLLGVCFRQPSLNISDIIYIKGCIYLKAIWMLHAPLNMALSKVV